MFGIAVRCHRAVPPTGRSHCSPPHQVETLVHQFLSHVHGSSEHSPQNQSAGDFGALFISRAHAGNMVTNKAVIMNPGNRCIPRSLEPPFSTAAQRRAEVREARHCGIRHDPANGLRAIQACVVVVARSPRPKSEKQHHLQRRHNPAAIRLPLIPYLIARDRSIRELC